MKALDRTIKDEAAMKQLGEAIARNLNGAEIIGLIGPFGSGKTTFVKGVAKGLSIKETVVSASFVLAQSLPGRLWLHHIDLYRLSSEQEIRRLLQWEGFFASDGVCLVEWAEKAKAILPAHTIYLTFSYHDHQRRVFGRIPDHWQC